MDAASGVELSRWRWGRGSPMPSRHAVVALPQRSLAVDDATPGGLRGGQGSWLTGGSTAAPRSSPSASSRWRAPDAILHPFYLLFFIRFCACCGPMFHVY
jgi:hypothetical protein